MGAILATYSQGGAPMAKKSIALVGTGIRGTIFWGAALNEKFGDLIEFVGLCDINPGRVAYAKAKGGSLWVHKATQMAQRRCR